MKKFVTVIVCTILISIVSTTESLAQFKMKVGPVVGMNFNIASGDLFTDTYTGLGILLGGQLDMSFTPMIGLITNVYFYDNKSHSYDYTNNQEDDDVTFRVSYFQIQPLFKLAIPKSGFYFFAGPGVGFSIQSKLKITQTVGNNNPVVTNYTLKNLGTRFELKAGSGFDINISKMVAITPEFSFAYGLTDVFSKGKSWGIMTFNLSAICKIEVL
jgi:hypothetical protein